MTRRSIITTAATGGYRAGSLTAAALEASQGGKLTAQVVIEHFLRDLESCGGRSRIPEEARDAFDAMVKYIEGVQRGEYDYR